MRGRLVGAVSAAVLGLVVGAMACGDDGGTEPPNENDAAAIVATVTADGAAESGVTVRLYEGGGSTAVATRQTGSNGRTTFADLVAGVYEVEVDVPAGLELATGQTARRSLTVAAGGSVEVAFALVAVDDPPSDVVEIRLTSSLTFDPSEVTISTGTTVRWINDANILHTVTPRDHTEWERVELDQSGETFEHTFETAGTFDYFCEPHESTMQGTITVQ